MEANKNENKNTPAKVIDLATLETALHYPANAERLEKAETTATRATFDVITADNVENIAQIIALRTLRTNYAKSGQEYVRDLFNGLCADIAENKAKGKPLSDGYDIVQEVSAFLCGYIGKRVSDPHETELTADGAPADLWRVAFRTANNYIAGLRKVAYTHKYVDDITETGEARYLQVPFEWDIDSARDLERLQTLFDGLPITIKQRQTLAKRLRGMGVREIANAEKVNLFAVQKRLQAIAEKVKQTTDPELLQALAESKLTD